MAIQPFGCIVSPLFGRMVTIMSINQPLSQQIPANKGSRPRVVVAMSGGVDSSVAAALLVEQGYEVIGMMMRLWSEEGKELLNRCCTPEQMDDARHIAAHLGIPFYVVDVKSYFRKTIVQFFLDEHAKGRTPNPCVECNREIRFSYLYDRAMSLEADYLATGHYAQVISTPAGYELRQGKDSHKDQSYVLHLLSQEQLGHLLFPVGGYTKPEVRALAEKFGLVSAKKSDSMDLCFLAGEDYRDFLGRHRPDISQPGPIYTAEGQLLGQHEGLPNYTIGQRKGLNVPSSIPLFVIGKDAQRNALILGGREQVGQKQLMVRQVNWVSGRPPAEPLPVLAKIRYKAQAVPATVEALPDGRAQLTFDEPVFGPTPGQAAVFYQADLCLGGGIIED